MVFTSPGVYIQELTSPVHTIVGVPTAIAAFVGIADRGPVDMPTTVSSVTEYARLFGSDLTQPLGMAVQLFFLNGGGQAVIVRASDSNNAVASATLDGGVALNAASPGAWGANLTAAWDTKGIPASNKLLYNLTLTDTATQTIERYVGVSTDTTSQRSLKRVLLGSNLATVKSGDDKMPTAGKGPASFKLPAAAPAPAAGGGAAAPAAPAAPAPVAYPPGDPTALTGIYALEKNNTFFNMLVLTPTPGNVDVDPAALAVAATLAQNHRAILIADAPSTWTVDTAASGGRDTFFDPFGEAQSNAAVYYPRVSVPDPAGGTFENIGPAPVIAGIYAATDGSRGVWKAPAGIATQLSGVLSLEDQINDSQNGQLNPIAVNCLRTFPVIGNVIWGARTMAGADIETSQWKYVPVRRLALFLEESLYRGTQWVVFEPNDEPLWAQIRLNVGSFMNTLFRQGAFQGTTAADAYFVKCDKDTNPQANIDQGIVTIIVGFAPLKPAEFVVIQLQQIDGSLGV